MASVRIWEVVGYARIKPSPQTVGSKATPPYSLLGGIPTTETSVDVLLLGERVAKKEFSMHFQYCNGS